MGTIIDRDQKPGFLPTTTEEDATKPKKAAGAMGSPKKRTAKRTGAKSAAKKTAKSSARKSVAKKAVKKKAAAKK